MHEHILDLNVFFPRLTAMLQFATNPFPGMNPWLEAYWGDVHSRLTTYACDEIQRQLPNSLHAHIEEYLAVEEKFDDVVGYERRISPDIVIHDDIRKDSAEPSVAILPETQQNPVKFRRVSERQTLRHIRIVDIRNHQRIVTAIEFLSPANKTPAGKAQYQRKQCELIDGEVNLVEIDLLRAGAWVIASEFMSYPANLRGPYRICVTRATSPLDGEAYMASFRHPLPSVRIPLRETDQDICLPLQKLLNLAYENGRYGQLLDYEKPPEIPCDESDWVWIQALLEQAKA